MWTLSQALSCLAPASSVLVFSKRKLSSSVGLLWWWGRQRGGGRGRASQRNLGNGFRVSYISSHIRFSSKSDFQAIVLLSYLLNATFHREFVSPECSWGLRQNSLVFDLAFPLAYHASSKHMIALTLGCQLEAEWEGVSPFPTRLPEVSCQLRASSLLSACSDSTPDDLTLIFLILIFSYFLNSTPLIALGLARTSLIPSTDTSDFLRCLI